jgi:hypothetical protein
MTNITIPWLRCVFCLVQNQVSIEILDAVFDEARSLRVDLSYFCLSFDDNATIHLQMVLRKTQLIPLNVSKGACLENDS